MGIKIPKQFLLLKDQPVIIHTIRKFTEAVPDAEIILVLPETHFTTWEKIAGKYGLQHIKYTAGGKTRFDSVKNGLTMAPGQGIISIHDAVRPYLSTKLIKNCFEEAVSKGSAVPSLPLKDSVRKLLDNNISIAEERDKLRLVQTPQCFDAEKLIKAYRQDYKPVFTDDATVFEAAGFPVYLIPGEERNTKITTPDDL